MRRLVLKIYALFFLFATACTASGVTEVGNPTVTSGTTKAVKQSTTSIFSSFSDEPQDIDCAFNQETNTQTCTCPEGGLMTQTFDGNFTTTDSTVTMNAETMTSFEDCAFLSCNDTVTISGEFSGTVTGTFNQDTGATNTTAEFATAAACSGISADGSTLGFDVTVTFDGTTTTMSGKICADGITETFDSLEELEAITDPTGLCEEDF